MFPGELYQFLGLLSVSLLVFMVCHKIRINLAVGYLIAGMILGPSVLGWMEQTAFLHTLGDIGILLFLFTVGLEIPLHRVRALRRYIFGLGLLQVLLSTTLIAGVLIFGGLVVGIPSSIVLILALAWAFSSTAIVVQVLSEKFELTSHLGRISLSILLFQDLIAILIFVFFGVLAALKGGTSSLWQCLAFSGVGVAVTVAVTAFLSWGTRQLFSLYRHSEFTTIFVLSSVIGMSLITEYFHLSSELGAFAVGMVLAGTHWRHQISTEIHPFRMIFLSIFFMVIGLEIDVMACGSVWPWMIGGLVGLLLLKMAVIFLCGKIWRLKWEVSLKLGILLGGCSEFLFLILPMPSVQTYLGKGTLNALLVMVFISMVSTPFLFAGCKRFLVYLRSKGPYEEPGAAHQQVIISGFGYIGRTIARILEQNFISFLIIEYDLLRVQAAQRENYQAINGDVRDIEFLKKIGIQHARVLLITFGHLNASVELVRILRQKFPALSICVQVKDYAQAHKFSGLGAHLIVPESVELGMQMASLTLQFLGFSKGYAQKMVHFPQTPLFWEPSRPTDAAERRVDPSKPKA